MHRLCLTLCVVLIVGLSASASTPENRPAPVVTAATSAGELRVVGSPSTVQLRVEVRSAAGAVVYDSGWRDGNLLDWSPQDGSGRPLQSGGYRLRMHSMDIA